jgi:hypothetical protein
MTDESYLGDGYWLAWSGWSVCSVTCGNGTISRTRQCQTPLGAGKPCEGDAKESKPCFQVMCPGKESFNGAFSFYGGGEFFYPIGRFLNTITSLTGEMVSHTKRER